jgi:hypothetical protein
VTSDARAVADSSEDDDGAVAVVTAAVAVLPNLKLFPGTMLGNMLFTDCTSLTEG